MMISIPYIESLIDIDSDKEYELVVENQHLFLKIISDISNQIKGETGEAILSINNTPVEWSKNADLNIQIVPFEINRKPLINKIIQMLEKESVYEENYLVTSELLNKIEMFIYDLTMEKSCELSFNKLSIDSILKAIGIEIDCSDLNDIDKIYKYMELVREFEKEKLFIFVNMRSYFEDEDITEFIKTSLSHDLRILLIESSDRGKLPFTERVVIDCDLCEF